MAKDDDWDKYELNRTSKLSCVKWILTGVVVQIAAYAIAVFSLGFGHGSGKLAKLLFPWPQLFGGIVTERSSVLPAILEHTQYVTYFTVIAIFASRRSKWIGLAFVLILHVSLVIFNEYL